jgi:hypothetical protein
MIACSISTGTSAPPAATRVAAHRTRTVRGSHQRDAVLAAVLERAHSFWYTARRATCRRGTRLPPRLHLLAVVAAQVVEGLERLVRKRTRAPRRSALASRAASRSGSASASRASSRTCGLEALDRRLRSLMSSRASSWPPWSLNSSPAARMAATRSCSRLATASGSVARARASASAFAFASASTFAFGLRFQLRFLFGSHFLFLSHGRGRGDVERSAHADGDVGGTDTSEPSSGSQSVTR